MDKYEREAYRPVPAGFVRVREGDIQPTDICLSVYEGEWREFGSTEWCGPATRVEDAFMVARPVAQLSMIDRLYGGHLSPIELIYGVGV